MDRSIQDITVIIPDPMMGNAASRLPDDLIRAFKAALRGDVINKGDTGYVMDSHSLTSALPNHCTSQPCVIYFV